MREMKDSGIEWIGYVPQSWKIEKVKYHFTNYKIIPGIQGQKYDRLALTLKGVVHRSKDDGEGLQPKDFLTYQLLKKNDLVFKLIDLQNISTSRVGLAHDTGLVSPAYIILHANDIVPEYAEKFFLMMWHRNIFNALGDAGVRSNLNVSDLLNITFTVPSLHDQQRIADYLDKKCAEIDELAEKIREQIDTLEKYKKSVITEAVTKGLNKNVPMKDSGIEWIGKIPSDWKLLKGKFIFTQRNLRGNSIELQLLSPTQKYGVIPQTVYEELSGMNTVKLNEKADLSALKTIHKGDFCISLRSFQGGFEYSDYEGVVSPAYQVFYPIVNVARGYYKYLFKEHGFIEKMNSYTMTLRDGKNIAFADFGNTYIPYPPVDKQQTIADYLDEKCAEIDEIISEKQEQLNVLDSYKKSTIYEYVTGKKEVPV